MPGFINETTNVTLEKIIEIINVTTPGEFLIRANQTIYNGVFYFVLLWVLWIILFMAAQKLNDKYPLQNAMYSGASVSIVGFIMRAITHSIDGVTYSLVTDHQMWIFPLITIVIAAIVWATKD